MNENKHFQNNKNITELDLYKVNNSLKEEIEEKFDKKIEDIKTDNVKTNSTLVRVEVLLENMGKNTEEIRKEMKEDRAVRKLEEEDRIRRHNDLEKQIMSVKDELNDNVETVERKLSDEIKGVKLGLDTKLNIDDFETKFDNIEKAENDSNKETKAFRRNASLTLLTVLLSPSVVLYLIQKFW